MNNNFFRDRLFLPVVCLLLLCGGMECTFQGDRASHPALRHDGEGGARKVSKHSGQVSSSLFTRIFGGKTHYGRKYYVSNSGDDRNDGSERHPFRTLKRVSEEELKPGSRVLLHGGDVFDGCLVLERDSGETGRPVLVSSYGEGRATIHGGVGNGIILSKCKNLIINNLNITGSGRKNNREGKGVEVNHSSFITLKDLETSGFQHAGIWINGCDSVTICRVHAHGNGFTGIGTDHRNQTSRIIVRKCRTDNNPGHPGIKDNHSGSGILLASVINGLAEYCEAAYNGWDMPRPGNGPVGIWTWNSDSVVIQYCISHHNKSPDFDGGGFDFDGGVTNSVMQYNFSHHNAGAGYLVCQFTGAPRDLSGNHIRFNISLDDGLGCHFAGIMIYVGGDLFKENYFYQNTIINTFHSDVNFDGIPEYLKNPPSLHFYNNLFISGKEQIGNLDLLPGTIFQGNLYWAYGDGGFSVGKYHYFGEWIRTTSYEKSESGVTGLFCDPLINSDFSSLPEIPEKLIPFPSFFPLEGSPVKGNGISLPAICGSVFSMNDFRGTPISANDRFIGAMK